MALAARYFGALREAKVRFAALSARSFCFRLNVVSLYDRRN
jgi:hypothetical protein